MNIANSHSARAHAHTHHPLPKAHHKLFSLINKTNTHQGPPTGAAHHRQLDRSMDHPTSNLNTTHKVIGLSVAIVAGVLCAPVVAVAGAIIAPIGVPMLVLAEVKHEAHFTKGRRTLGQKDMNKSKRMAVSLTVIGGVVCAPLNAVAGAAILPIAVTKSFAEASMCRKVRNPLKKKKVNISSV